MKVPALVSAPWLRQQMLNKSKQLRILDATWHKPWGPDLDMDGKKDHLKCRIPSSRFFNLDECRNKASPYLNMLPSEQQFADHLEKLGICNDSHVVVYDANKLDLYGFYTAPRLWWTFRVFGHNLVSVLDGGLPKWQQHDYPTISAPAEQDIPTEQKKIFKTAFQKHLVYDFESMKNNIESPKSVQVGDTRTKGMIEGLAEAFPNLPVGSIPRTNSVPISTLVDPDKKQMKSPEELQTVFQTAGIDLQQPLVATCIMGVTATTMALAAHTCGNTNVAIYDGSWFEWGDKAPKNLIDKVNATC